MLRTTLVLGSVLFAALGCGSDHTTKTVPKASTGATDAGLNLPRPPGTERFEFTMDSFDVPVEGELYKCQDFPNPFGKDIAIVQSGSVMTTGSHHMFAFRIAPDDPSKLNLAADGSKGPLVDCPEGGVEFHPYFHDSQTTERVFTYPAGVGRSLKGADGIRLMVHFLNTTQDVLRPKLSVTVDYVDASAVEKLAAEFFLSAVGVVVPPGQSIQRFSFAMPADVNVLTATGHMHRRGTHLDASVVESADGGTADAGLAADAGIGTPIYSTDTWDEPKPSDFAPPFQIRKGERIKFACSYANDTTTTFTFGESAANNEMCIFQGTFYPSPDGNGIDPFLF